MSMQGCAGAMRAVNEIENLIITLQTSGCTPEEIVIKVLERCRLIKKVADIGYY